MALNPEEKKTRAEKRRQKRWDKVHKIKNGIVYKWCTYSKHWVEENDDNFYRNNNNKTDGYCTECIDCSILRTQMWQLLNPEKYEKAIKKRNKNPSERRLKTLQRLGKEKRERGYDAEYRRTHKEKINELSRKRREKYHIITEQEWYNCKLYFNFRCAYCGKTYEQNYEETKQDLHKDHTIWDGKNDLSNCIPSCKSCNSFKHQASLNNWYNYKNENYTYERYHKIYLWLRYDYKKYIIPKRRYKSQRMSQRLKEIEQNKRQLMTA
jgi:hypothetical protein